MNETTPELHSGYQRHSNVNSQPLVIFNLQEGNPILSYLYSIRTFSLAYSESYTLPNQALSNSENSFQPL
jgi:hypothetical protein